MTDDFDRVEKPGGFRSAVASKKMLLGMFALADVAWVALVGLIVMFNSGDYDFWFPGRVLTYVLLVIAPALTFVPIGRALRLPLYGYGATVSWAIFSFIIAFVPSDPQFGWRENVGRLGALLAALFAVTVTVCLPVFYRLGFRLFRRRVEQYDLSRARREAMLAGLWVLLTAFLRVVGALSLVIAVALFLAFIILELLILTRTMGRN